MRARGWLLLLVSLAAGALFFGSLHLLWPLVDTDLTRPADEVRAEARRHLESLGFDLDGYRAASRLRIDGAVLDYVDRAFGREQTQAWVREGSSLVYYRVLFKKRGESIGYVVRLHPSGNVIAWSKSIDADHEGARLPVEQARRIASRLLDETFALDPGTVEETSVETREESDLRAHTFGYERLLSAEPELRERITITVAGDEPTFGSRYWLQPPAARREARARQAPRIALETVGFLLAAVSGIAAIFIFLRHLRDGSVQLGRAAVWPAIVFVCLMATFMLEGASLVAYWEPLWPLWVSAFRYFFERAGQQVWLVLFLLALVAAGNALDGKLGAGRGNSLALAGRGKLLHPSVALASGRGFLIGLCCGGTLSLAVLAVGWLTGGGTSLQPRGFFLYSLNSASPAITSLLFFLGVALAEELGYRYFGGSWLLQLTGSRWLAILLPGLIYGLTHTRMDFLPPADPFWARALVLTLVGCVWGWAFLRYDALTVVLSHFTADLFIFNWPRLASGETLPVVSSLATLAVPLLPAILFAICSAAGRAGPRPRPAS